jgi:hypothetical protein
MRLKNDRGGRALASVSLAVIDGPLVQGTGVINVPVMMSR